MLLVTSILLLLYGISGFFNGIRLIPLMSLSGLLAFMVIYVILQGALLAVSGVLGLRLKSKGLGVDLCKKAAIGMIVFSVLGFIFSGSLNIIQIGLAVLIPVLFLVSVNKISAETN